ncbi:MAG: hypothetical protein MJ096_02765 [Clostridia bacterium]|nr:hypothetical protein [Clostridia bacterium]
MDTNRVLSLAGLCRRAGGVIPGAGAVTAALRGGSLPKAVIYSSDASDRTKKQIRDKSSHRGVTAIEADIGSDEIGRALGLTSPCAVFALSGRGPSDELIRALSDQ